MNKVLKINLKAELSKELTNRVLRILHHDIDETCQAGKWEMNRLNVEFGLVLEPLLAERKRLYKKVADLEKRAALQRM